MIIAVDLFIALLGLLNLDGLVLMACVSVALFKGGNHG